MKKVLCIILSAVLVFSLSACGGETAGSQAVSASGKSSSAVSSSDTSASGSDGSSSESSSSETLSASSAESSSSEASSSVSSEEETVPPVIDPPVSDRPESGDSTVTVTYTPKKAVSDGTFTGLPPLPTVTYTVNDPENTRGLSEKGNGFSYGVAKNGSPNQTTVNNQAKFDSLGQNMLAWDNISEEKVLYLTFDCGYEYEGCAAKILDTLKEKEVPAAFFCTMQFLKEAPDAAARMINEGHILGNHTANHPDCTTVTREKMAYELLAVDNYLRVNFGYTSRYFRYPTGNYSNCTAELAYSLGYRSIFWSIAYVDWDPKNQMAEDEALKTVTDRLHPGAVILLHTTAPTNVAILGEFIDTARAMGYTFKSLNEYPGWKS